MRRIYSNVYLFDTALTPIQTQKSMRECDLMCRECILDVVRDSMPVSTILRSYIDNTVEEDIIEEVVEKTDVSQNDMNESTQEPVIKDTNKDKIINAPFNTPVSRLDETKANRELNLRWTKNGL